MTLAGKHCLRELHGCPKDLRDDPTFVQDTLRKASEASRATILQVVAHRFEPQGVTALGLLSESHISIHTWPENSYAAADIFTCGENCDPEKACEYLREAFECARYSMTTVARGMSSGLAAVDGNTITPHSFRGVRSGATPESATPKVKDVSCPEANYAQTSG